MNPPAMPFPVKISESLMPPEQHWLTTLTPETTLRDLPMYDATVDPEVVTTEIDRLFGIRPDLPGVAVATGRHLLGMISRQTLLSHLSRPFGQDIYLKRPIRLMLEAVSDPPLALAGELSAAEGAQIALHRPAKDVYEPVVVKLKDGFRVLDAHTLLIAQSRLLELANASIRDHAAAADSANQAKSLFLANMSHEIRTPLTAILGFAENLLDGGGTAEERTTATQTILRNGHHLLQLINDILDLSKIEAGRLDVEHLRFSPGDVVNEVMSALQVRADSRQVDLQLKYDGRIPAMIYSDPTRLRQILMNLVGNAIKFTEHGCVIVRLQTLNADSPSPLLQCDVSDTGIGMTDDQIERLFTPFTQADGSMARRFGGTGLGLSISRRLAVLLGGDIAVTSAVNQGSTFSVTIETGDLSKADWHSSPRALDESRPVISSEANRLTQRILLAEDGPDNQLLIGTFLRKLGADVTIVDNGRKAVDAALISLSNGHPFDLILMDMQMPILDGYSATRELRAHGWQGPILALTANAMSGDRQKCLDAGCNDFASKPFDRIRLQEQIRELTSGSELNEVSETVVHEIVPVFDVSTDVFDPQVALRRMGGDADLLDQIAGMIVTLGPQWLQELQQRLDERDTTSVRRLAHSLKNSAENVAGQTASTILFRVETFAARDDLNSAAALFPEARDRMFELIRALKQFQKSQTPAMA
ncbi:MAG: response regulator [Planctomycetes bacterium]|nr:response regulator [Planctomycetota bacterium]